MSQIWKMLTDYFAEQVVVERKPVIYGQLDHSDLFGVVTTYTAQECRETRHSRIAFHAWLLSTRVSLGFRSQQFCARVIITVPAIETLEKVGGDPKKPT